MQAEGCNAHACAFAHITSAGCAEATEQGLPAVRRYTGWQHRNALISS